MAKRCKQYNLFGEPVSDSLMPTAKRPKTGGQREVYKCSWTNSAPCQEHLTFDLPAIWLLYLEDHSGMFCKLCTKYNKEPVVFLYI